MPPRPKTRQYNNWRGSGRHPHRLQRCSGCQTFERRSDWGQYRTKRVECSRDAQQSSLWQVVWYVESRMLAVLHVLRRWKFVQPSEQPYTRSHSAKPNWIVWPLGRLRAEFPLDCFNWETAISWSDETNLRTTGERASLFRYLIWIRILTRSSVRK